MKHETQTVSDQEKSSQQPKRVTEFRSAAQDNDPLLYPGERPETSYVTDGMSVRAIDVANIDDTLVFTIEDEEGPRPLDEYLHAQGVPTIEDRIPVLAFGANMSPSSLKSKFTKVGRPDAHVIPTIYGALPGHDVVWSSGPGVNGNPIAILYEGEETKDTTVQVGVNFLTREQMIVMHATELAYNLSSVTVEVADKPIKAYYYAGHDSVYTADTHPVAIESIPAEGRVLTEASAEGLVDDVMQHDGVQTAIKTLQPDATVENARDYVVLAESLKSVPGARLALRKAVHAAVAAADSSKITAKADAIDRLESWANPSTIPTYGEQQRGIYHHNVYRLPSQELGEWADQEARRRVLRTMTTHLIRMSGGALTERTTTERDQSKK